MPKVLLIDDSKTIQKVAALILRGSAWRLLTAEDGESGKQIALRERPDIALVDFTLAPKNGLELIGEFLSEPNLQGMKLALLYSQLKSVSPVELEKVGVVGKLAKPFDADEFWGLLKNLNASEIKKETQKKSEEKSEKEIEKEDEVLGIISSPQREDDPLKNLFTEEDLDKYLNFSEKPLAALIPKTSDPKISDKDEVVEGIFCQDAKASEDANKVLAKKTELAVEKVCRDVIPPLAEKIIREEIQKLIKESR